MAIKKIYKPFSCVKRARQLYYELKLLQLINHANIIHLIDMYSPEQTFQYFKNV